MLKAVLHDEEVKDDILGLFEDSIQRLNVKVLGNKSEDVDYILTLPGYCQIQILKE